MAVAAVGDEPLGLVQGIRKIRSPVHGQDRGELFVGKSFGQLDTFHFTDQDLCSLRNLHTGKLGDGVGGLADNLGVQRAVNENGIADLIGFFGVQNIAAAICELGLGGFVDAVQQDDGLLGGADHAVVEGLGMDDGVDCQLQISGIVDDGGSVAGADADGGLTGGIRCLHHTGAAGGQDDVRFLHDQIAQLQRGSVNPADDALGRACFHSGFQDDLCGFNGALLCPGMGADDHAVAGLQGDQSLENGSGSGVGGGNDGGDDTDGLGDLLDAESSILLNDTTGFGVLIGVIDILGGIVVLDDLVFHHAHAGLLHGHLCQRDPGPVSGGSGSQEDLIHLLLRIGSEKLLSSTDTADSSLQLLGVGHGNVIVQHNKSTFPDED